MHKTIASIAFFLITFMLSAQNLSGIWQGVLYQPNPQGVFYFVYTITIQQTGNTITATSYAPAYGTILMER
jgi:outer membrane receptor for monomeric catechols